MNWNWLLFILILSLTGCSSGGVSSPPPTSGPGVLPSAHASRSKWGPQALQIQGVIAEAFRSIHHPKPEVPMQIAIWAESDGRITRASLSSGDPVFDDEAIAVLLKTDLGPLPPDMPMPVLLKLGSK